MTKYQHVLAAVDLTEEAPQVLEHAQQMARENGAQLSVMTVVRPLTYAYAGLDVGWVSREMADFETQSERITKEKLAKLAATVGVREADTYVILGVPAPSVKTQAKLLDADLIVLGTHGRHGLGLILGSTANGVLHGASCDVLAVKIDSEAQVQEEAA